MSYFTNCLRKKVLVGVITAACIYSIWTSYNVGLNQTLNLKKQLCKENSNSCSEKDIKIYATLTPSTQTPLRAAFGTDSDVSLSPLNIINNSDINIRYRKKWVGFPEIQSINCVTAFDKFVNNSLFPQAVIRIFPEQFVSESKDCHKFNEKYGYNRYPPASQEELDFPIAFVILFYKDLDQVLFLLRALYQPHNVYCLTIDTKASIQFLEAVRSVTRCLPNVFLASKLENIVYAGFTRLMADIDCMDDLLRHPVQWKYVINMPGQQFPLRTNLELVKIIKKYNGANDVEGITGDRMLLLRFKWKHVYVRDNLTGEVSLVRTNKKNSPPPHLLTVVKGSAYGTFSRAFVSFVINNPVAKDFLEWSKSLSSPDEYFWATLHHSKIVPAPGGYTAGDPEKKSWLTTYASWGGRDPCTTIRTRSVCIFSPGDLPHLMTRYELFANKFYITHHPAALHCLDQLLFNLTMSRRTRDLSYYQNLPFALATD